MGLSIWHLLLVLAIVLVLFGAKRLRNVGGDLGAAIKGFKDAVTDGKKEEDTNTATPGNVYDAQVAPTVAPHGIAQQANTAQPQATLAPTASVASQNTTPTQAPHNHS